MGKAAAKTLPLKIEVAMAPTKDPTKRKSPSWVWACTQELERKRRKNRCGNGSCKTRNENESSRDGNTRRNNNRSHPKTMTTPESPSFVLASQSQWIKCSSLAKSHGTFGVTYNVQYLTALSGLTALVISTRLVVLSTPPFLVVHTNAAYCRLTGIDSHKVVGKPIRALLSVPEEGLSAMQGFQDESSEAAAGNNSELAAAAAAGRARASQQNRQSVELERMVASSGFGHLHTLRVHAKQHHLVGKNVSFIPDGTPRVAAAAAANAGVRDEGSHDTSLTGSFEGHPFIRCQTSVAPVVSSVTCLESMVVSDREGSIHQKAKRRKLHGAPEAEAQRKPHAHAPKESTTSHRKHALPLRTTHFIIQLQPLVSGKQGSEESLSSNSTSVEARLLGISKAELLAQRQTVHTSKAILHESDALQADDDAAASESTGTREPVSTVG